MYEVTLPKRVLNGEGSSFQVILDEEVIEVSDDKVRRKRDRPYLIVTPAWLHYWRQAWTQKHPEWSFIDKQAQDGSIHFLTIAYQITKEKSYAREAVRLLKEGGALTKEIGSTNDQRENFLKRVIFYDWLYDALTTDEKELFHSCFQRHVDYAKANSRVTDSDVVVGNYFGLAALSIACAEFHSAIYNSDAWPNGGPEHGAGGYHKSFDNTKLRGSRRNTLRNCIADYMDMSQGGEFIESSQYNLNTCRLMMLGYLALYTGLGEDVLPEVTEFFQQAGEYQLHRWTPDLKNAFRWGDMETGKTRGLGLYEHEMTTLAMFFSIGGYFPILDLLEGFRRNNSFELIRDFYYIGVPEVSSPNEFPLSIGAGAPLVHCAEGQGIVLARDKWGDPNATFFAVHNPNINSVDHVCVTYGNWELYRRGEYIVSHPKSYSGVGEPEGFGSTNALLIHNLPPAYRNRRQVEFEHNDKFVRVVAETGGEFIHHRNPASADFLHKWQRLIEWRKSLDSKSDVVVIQDQIQLLDNAINTRFHWSFANRFTEGLMKPKIQFVVNIGSSPTISADRKVLSWTTKNGQNCELHSFFTHPQPVVHSPTYWDLVGKEIPNSEKVFFHVRVSGEGECVHVLSVFDEVAPRISRNDRGIVIKRVGHDDETVVL